MQNAEKGVLCMLDKWIGLLRNHAKELDLEPVIVVERAFLCRFMVSLLIGATEGVHQRAESTAASDG